MSAPNIAIVGATGAVGRELLEIIEQRRFPFSDLRLLASARSAGAELACCGKTRVIEELSEGSFAGVDLALFSAGGARSRHFAPIAASAGAIVVDNSSAFRMDPDVPLVVPEVNADALAGWKLGAGRAHGRIIANPNCSTIIMLVPVTPLHRAFGVKRIEASTYQAVSGAGAAAMRELTDQARDVLAGRDPAPGAFPEPCAFNVFSHDSAVDPETGMNVEEQKMIDETRKIWGAPDVAITATCVRVPVLRAHTEAITVTLAEPATPDAVRRILKDAPGVVIVDDRAGGRFPTPLKATGRDNVLVGRIRPDPSQPSDGDRHTGFHLFVSGDQLRKGAALNAIQIAELLV